MSAWLYSRNIQQENRNYFLSTKERMVAFQEYINRYESTFLD